MDRNALNTFTPTLYKMFEQKRFLSTDFMQRWGLLYQTPKKETP